MNKETFEMIMDFSDKITDAFLEAEKIIGDEKASELFGELESLVAERLGFDRWEDIEVLFDDENLMYLTEKYEDVPKYLKLYIVHEYDNGMVACVSTSESFYIVPKKYLAKLDEKTFNK